MYNANLYTYRPPRAGCDHETLDKQKLLTWESGAGDGTETEAGAGAEGAGACRSNADHAFPTEFVLLPQAALLALNGVVNPGPAAFAPKPPG